MKNNMKKEKVGITQALKLLWKIMSGKDKLYFLCLCFSIIARATAYLMQAQILAAIVSKLQGNEISFFGIKIPTDINIFVLITLCFVLIFITWCIGIAVFSAVDIFASKMVCKLNDKALEWTLEPRKNMDLKMTNGEASYIIRAASDNVITLFDTLIDVVPQLLAGVMALVFIAGIDIIAFAVIAIACLLIGVGAIFRMKIDKKITNKIEDVNSHVNNHMLSSIVNLPLITMLSSKVREFQNLKALNSEYYKQNKKRYIIMFCYWALIMILEYGATILATCLAIFRLGDGFEMADKVIILITYTGNVFLPIENMGWQLGMIQQSSIKICRLMSIKTNPENLILLKEKKDISNEIIEKIEIKNLNYKIGSFQRENINAEFFKNDLTVLIGASGAGKTTTIESILGLKEKTSGEIILNNKIKVDSLFQYSDRISYVMQGTMLFDRSVFQNVVYPNEEMPESGDKFIKVLGLTKLLAREREEKSGSFSSTLSGGEKKRLNLARGLMRDADIYILDEPTNELDEKNVVKVLKVLEELKKDKIVIVISHDERVMKIADKIVDLSI